MIRLESRLSKIMAYVLIISLGMISPLWCAQSDYDGYFAGTYSGDDNGVWIGLIDSSPNSFFMSYSTDNDDVDLGFFLWDGELGNIGTYFITQTEIYGGTLEIDIDSSNGMVSGQWSHSGSSSSGLLTGALVTSVVFAGTYSGTYSGGESGTWTMTIASDGRITGSFAHTSNSGYGDIVGICHPNGYVLLLGEDVISKMGVAMFGEISGSDISGGWESESGYSGTFTTAAGVVGAGSSGGSGGGGGGGCFITTLIK